MPKMKKVELTIINTLLEIAKKCNDNDCDECVIEIDTKSGTVKCHIEFEYFFK